MVGKRRVRKGGTVDDSTAEDMNSINTDDAINTDDDINTDDAINTDDPDDV